MATLNLGSNGVDKSLEIIVSGAKETSSTIIRQGNTSAGLFNPSALPRGLAAMDRLQQHSIESSVVTEVELSWLNCDIKVFVFMKIIKTRYSYGVLIGVMP